MQCRGHACLVAFVTSATLFFTQTLRAQLRVATAPTAMDRYAACCVNFALAVTRMAVLGAQRAPEDAANQLRDSAGISNRGAPRLVRVQGHMMRVRAARLADRQQGRPIVVLQSGALQSIDTWGPIFNRVAVLTPVIAYDRQGIGRSEFDGEPPTLAHVNETLHALLAAINAPPPYVLVGHSYGGVLTRAFARQYPTEVAGMVYLDVPDTDLTIADLAAVSPDAAGVLRSELDGLPPDLPTGMRAELDNIRRLMANDFIELNAVRPPAGIPVAAVVAAGKLDQVRDPVERSTREAILRIQIRHQQDWALSSRQGLFVVTKRGGHNVHHDNPDLTVAAIRHVLATIAMR